MKEVDDNFKKYEQMCTDSDEAPNPKKLISKKNHETNSKNNNYIFIFILILIITILGIYYIYKYSYFQSLSELINNYENEINILSKKEIELQTNIFNLTKNKDTILDKNYKINKQIEEIKEENKKLENENKIMHEGLKEKQRAIEYFEDKINSYKTNLSNIIFQQNSIREKIKNCDERIEVYKLKIGDLKMK